MEQGSPLGVAFIVFVPIAGAFPFPLLLRWLVGLPPTRPTTLSATTTLCRAFGFVLGSVSYHEAHTALVDARVVYSAFVVVVQAKASPSLITMAKRSTRPSVRIAGAVPNAVVDALALTALGLAALAFT